ncbi:MAG: T9SS type A sorting domain-containing protein [Bacteroidota bacterium]
MNTIKYFFLLIFFSISGYLNYFPPYNPSLSIVPPGQVPISSSGFVDYTTIAGSQDARFTLFGDGYFGTLSNFDHQFPANLGGYTTKTYFNRPYKKHIPTLRTVNTGPTGNGTSTNNKISMPFDSDNKVATSWSPSPGIENYFMLIFENRTTSIESGCVEFYYNDFQLSLDSTGILEYGWVSGRTHSVVNTLGPYNQKLSWSFSNLMPDEQRVIYIPMHARVEESTRLFVGSSKTSSCSGPGGKISHASIMSSGYPHDPNVKLVNKGCIDPLTSDPQTLIYTVKFQNEGTAPANNVYLTDYIDESYLDLKTLKFIDSEYPYSYSVTGNLLRINFSNINLPGTGQTGPKTYTYDETESWVQFRICTHGNSPIGNIYNQVGIVFDTQPIIMTDVSDVLVSGDCMESATECEALKPTSTAEEFQAPDISISPNPVQHVMSINGLNDHNVIVNVYNSNGELVVSKSDVSRENNAVSTVDLTSGMYFVQIKNEMINITKKVFKI